MTLANLARLGALPPRARLLSLRIVPPTSVRGINLSPRLLVRWLPAPGNFLMEDLVKEGSAVVSDEPFFIGPDGKRITLADLPSPDLLNLSPALKSVVVAGVRHGLITLGEACEHYHLSLDEYLSWHRSFAGEVSAERR